MDLVGFLKQERDDVIQEAFAATQRAGLKHYAAAGEQATREHLTALYDLAVSGIATRNLTPMIEHARRIAADRFQAGFDLAEVQAAFNVLEEALWQHIFAKLAPAEFAQSIGLVSTALGAGKDSLARSYVQLASKSHVPTLNLSRMFEGVEGT
jgi:hypothetical protein